MRTKVAIIKGNYSNYGGSERYSKFIIDNFLEKGCDVTLITVKNSQWPNSSNVKIIALPCISIDRSLELLTFNYYVNKFLTHTNEKFNCILSLDNVINCTHIRLGGGIHVDWLQKILKYKSTFNKFLLKIDPYHHIKCFLQAKIFKNPNIRKIICNSYFEYKIIEKYFPNTIHKVTVVYNGVRWSEFEPFFWERLKKRDDILSELGLPKDFSYFLYVGSGYFRKGVDYLLRAFKYLPDYTKLLIIGKEKNLKKYLTLVDDLQLNRRVYFLGSKKNVIPYFQVADFFVLPSLYDPFPNAALEALAMGNFIIVSSSTGVSEIINEQSGIVINDPANVDELKNAMLLALNRKIDKVAIRESVKKFELKDQISKIINLCLYN